MGKRIPKQDIYFILTILVLSVTGILVRIPGLGHLSGDMIDCYLPWYESLPAHQGIGVLKNYTGDYGLPYATILWLLHYIPGSPVTKIKIVSVSFEYLLAASTALLSSHFYCDNKKRVAAAVSYGITLFYPALILNGAWWGQIDSAYAAFVILSVYCLFKEKTIPSFIFLGLATAAKLQTIFIVPFLIMFYYRRRIFSLLEILIIPITVEILYIPAMIAGYSPLTPITMYLEQTAEYPQMYMHYPGIWCYFWQLADYEMFHLPVIGWVASGFIAFFCLLLLKGTDLSDETWISIAFWSSLFPVYFLPAMHERYSIIAEIIAVVYLMIRPRRWWISSFLWLTISWAVYQPMILDRLPEQEKTALGMMFILIALTSLTVYDVLKDKNNTGAQVAHKITSPESKFLEIFDKYGIYPAVAFVFIISVWSCIKTLPFVNPDYLQTVWDNDSILRTPLYRLIISASESFTGLGLEPLQAHKVICIFFMFPAAFLWMALTGSAHFKTKSHTEKNGKDIIRSSLFLIGFLMLPATIFYPIMECSLDGLCLILSGIGTFLFMKAKKISAARQGSRSKYYTISAVVLFGLSAAISPAYLLFNAFILVIFNVPIKNALQVAAASMIITVLTELPEIFTGSTPMELLTCLLRNYMLQGAVVFPLSILLLILCRRNIRYIISLFLFEFGSILDFGRFIGAIREKYYILIPILTISSLITVIGIIKIYDRPERNYHME